MASLCADRQQVIYGQKYQGPPLETPQMGEKVRTRREGFPHLKEFHQAFSGYFQPLKGMFLLNNLLANLLQSWQVVSQHSPEERRETGFEPFGDREQFIALLC